MIRSMTGYGQGSAEAESLLLVKSIRLFGGRWRNNPIWVMIPNRIETLAASTRQSLEAFEARLLPFEVKAETLAFLYGGKVVASAAAETLAGYAGQVNAKKAETIGTASGGSVKISVKDGKVIINDTATIIGTVPASNGLVHVVDAVVLPQK